MHRLIRVEYVLFVLVAVPFFWAGLSIIPVDIYDEVFIAFNYARHFALGEGFVYDARHIPTQGFSSMMWVLIMSVFSYFSMDLFGWGIIVNLIALLVVPAIFSLYMERAGYLRRYQSLLLSVIFYIFAFQDLRGLRLVSIAFETMLVPLFPFIGICAADAIIRHGIHARKRLYVVFFAAAQLAYTVRIDTLPVFALMGIYLLIFSPARRRLLFAGGLFVVSLGFYLAGLWWIFGDPLPTGYYRKVSDSGLPGMDAVMSFLTTYAYYPYAAYIGLAAVFLLPVFIVKKRITSYPKAISDLRSTSCYTATHLIALILLTVIAAVAPIAKALPYPDTFPRYFVVGMFVSYLLHAWLLVYIYDRIAILRRCVPAGLLALCLSFVHYQFIQNKQLRPASLSAFFSKTKANMDGHMYSVFGRTLTKYLGPHSNVSFAYGDAGAIPYSWDGIFIDTNGLTEPAIARMFPIPNSPEKAKLYADYLISQNIDILVIATQSRNDKGFHSRFFGDSPFKFQGGSLPIVAYQALYESGYRYLCTVTKFYSGLHLLARPGSPHFLKASSAMLELAKVDGERIAEGLKFEDGVQVVHFSALDLLPPNGTGMM